MKRRALLLAIVVLAVPMIAGYVIVMVPARPGADATGTTPPPSATATIERRTLVAKTTVDGTLGYADALAIVNQLATLGGADPAAAIGDYASARVQYDTALNERDILRHPKTADVATAQAQLAQVIVSLREAEQAADGPSVAEVNTAKAQLAQAQATLVSSREAAKGPTAAQLAQVQANLALAQANLLAARNAAAGPSQSDLAQAQLSVTQATAALATDQAALARAMAALAACADPAPPRSSPCDRDALEDAVRQARDRVTVDQAQLEVARAQLASLTSVERQAKAQANLATAEAAVGSAQEEVDALTAAQAQAKAQANLATAEAAAESAQAALDALLTGDRTKAKAQLESARASVWSAHASLDALLHPGAGQLRLADDRVKAARAGLDMAMDKLDQPRGVVTSIASPGSVVQPGGVLYALDGDHPVVLMRGDVPAWRSLAAGVTDGPDVRALEENLQALGFASAKLEVDRHWDVQTTAAVKRWQRSLGLSADGTIELGEVVFQPGAIRVTTNAVTAGATVQQGTAVLEGTSTSRAVAVKLDVGDQTYVKLGDHVEVMLLDGSTTAGTVADISAVATAATDGSKPTVAMRVTLDDPAAAGRLDQAPVRVAITTETRTDVLAVPVEALVSLLEGGYAVEIDEGGARHFAGVQPGLFADGWVEVDGERLAAGQTVVVPR